MTNERYKTIQNIIWQLQVDWNFCDNAHDEETTQRQNFGANMEDESELCKRNEKRLFEAMTHIQSAIEELKQIDR